MAEESEIPKPAQEPATSMEQEYEKRIAELEERISKAQSVKAEREEQLSKKMLALQEELQSKELENLQKKNEELEQRLSKFEKFHIEQPKATNINPFVNKSKVEIIHILAKDKYERMMRGQ